MSTRSKIIKVALKHFANSSYKNCSLEEIAKELNITKPALYYHFKNKNDLYNTLFKNYFGTLVFKKHSSLEENLKEYINVYNTLFTKEPLCAKLFLKELACEFKNLDLKTISMLSNNLKFLIDILKDKKNVNPFYIQTLIMSSLTAYQSNMNIRKEVAKMINQEFDKFNIADEIYHTILLYIKDKK